MIRRYRLAAVIGPAVVIAAVGVVTIAGVQRSADADAWVVHTIEVRETAARALATVNAGADPAPIFATLRELTADNPVQQSHLATLALKPSPDSVRAVLAAIDAEERGLLVEREASAARWRTLMVWVVILGAGFAALFAFVVNAIVARYAMESEKSHA